MRARCPECKYPEVRIHAAIHRVGMRKRFWIVGAFVFTRTLVGADVSCMRCRYAFSVVGDEVIELAEQQAHEALMAARQRGAVGKNDQPRMPGYDRDLNLDTRDAVRR